VIRVYPDGRFSGFLDTELAVGDKLDVVGPFGVFTLRDGRDSDLVFVGGGAGMAPILSVLRSLAERGSTRKATYYYGARQQRDLCFEEELRALSEQLPHFTFVPALSEAGDEEGWDGEAGMITDVVKRHETDLSDTDSYVCGPPPMVEAAMEVLTTLGAPEKHIYYDKFTTTGSA
jgi:propane monooxygenase reductase subunit